MTGGIALAFGGTWRGSYAGGFSWIAAGVLARLLDAPLGHSLIALGAVVLPVGAFLGAHTESRLRRLPCPLGVQGLALCLPGLYVFWWIAVVSHLFVPERHLGQSAACRGNLRQIVLAKQHWARGHHALAGAVPTDADLVPTYLKQTPLCPAGGTYSYGALHTTPVCSFVATDPAHVLPLN